MPEMTVAQQISFVKRLARADSTYLTGTYTDDVARHYVNQGVEEFAKKAIGPAKTDFIDVTPTFFTRTTWYINLTITGGSNALAATDIAITGTDADDASGTTVAAALEATIQAAGAATATVAWSVTDWTFTIDALDSTSITVVAPTGTTTIDATTMLFGKTGTDTGTTWTSLFPEDCTLKSALPTDFMRLIAVEYDKHRLYEAPFSIFMSPETATTYPEHYAIQDKYIYIAPVPSDRRLLKIVYSYLPTAVTLTGSSDTSTCPLAVEFHMAPVYYAAGMVLRETFEKEESDRNLGLFYDQLQQYRMKESNQNTKMFPRNIDFHVPKVNVT